VTIAVVIVNFNGGDMLSDCLAALREQSVKPTRVLVMDNGSHDGSIERARARHPWAEYHLLDANLGFAKGNNIGIDRAADCEWVALLNPDAFPERDWLEVFLKRAREFPDVDVFASRMLVAQDPRLVDGAGDAYRVDGLAWPRFQGRLASEMTAAPEEVFAPCAGAAFYRRQILVAAGGFCERFFCYYEDVDLGFRLRLYGSRCVALPDAVVHHMGSAITGKGSPFSVYHAHRNFMWTYIRNMPDYHFWVYLPAHVGANLVSVLLFMRKGMGRTILRAKWDALKGLRETWRERKSIQSKRNMPADAVLAAMQRGTLASSISGAVRRSVRRTFSSS
jgi:GT2 family glycosyltransferase